MHSWIAPLGVIALIISCQTPQSKTNIEDPILASVGPKQLRESTVEQILHAHSSQEDSFALSTAYVDQWIRDQLMMREASGRFDSDEEVDRLVEDYRDRLLKHRLESAVIDERFDDQISDEELKTLYDEVKAQFKLNEPIIRCTFVKFAKETKSLNQFYKDWKADKEHAVRTFAAAYGEEMMLDTSVWRPIGDAKKWYSGFSERVALQKKGQRQIDENSQYYLKVIDVMDKGDFSPLTYIKPQLERMLLHQRRRTVIEDYKQELYEKALSRGIIKM